MKIFDLLIGTFGFRNPANTKKPVPEINTLTPEWLMQMKTLASKPEAQKKVSKQLSYVLIIGATFLFLNLVRP